MCRFIETIRVEQGCPCNVDLHQERLDRTRAEAFGAVSPLDLVRYVDENCKPQTDTVKCRIVYDWEFRSIEFIPYTRPAISSLLLIEADGIDYHLKSADRSALDALHRQALEAGCSDALIVRDGLLTDTTFCNVALSRDGLLWHTPARPLLKGVMREAELRLGRMEECDIPAASLAEYRLIALFNAMNPMGGIVLPVSAVVGGARPK
jgi:4-amino-4-deoxychorismate lyase